MAAMFWKLWLSQDLTMLRIVAMAQYPVWMALILSEYFISRRHSLDNFDRRELWVTARLAVLQRLISMSWTLLIGPASQMVYQYRLFTPKADSIWTVVLSLFLVDLAYYATHRFMHESRWGWATHVTHHTAKKYNLSIGFRLGLTHEISLTWVCYVLIPILGINPMWVAICINFQYFYEFFTHTELVPEMRRLGWIFNLPHHHRVHHGYNPEYINCNFGGILIVFDRLFGTYREKLPHVPVVYGVKDPPEEKFWAVSFYGWKELWQDIRREHSLRQVISGSRDSQLKIRDEHLEPTPPAFHENESFVLAGKTDLS